MEIPQPHQLRVLQEEAELTTRYTALLAFLDSDKICSLDLDEQARLAAQSYAMFKYQSALRDRIAHF